jgi:uncharacterized protein YkwD
VAAICLTVPIEMAKAHPKPAAKPENRCDDAERAPGTASLHSLRHSVLCLVNRIRGQRGLELLSENAELNISAVRHSEDMVENGYFSHYGPGGSTPLARVAQTGYTAGVGEAVVGENLGWGVGARYGSPLAVFRAWMHSPSHRANILSPRYRDAGVGVSRGSPFARFGLAGTYTLDLGTRAEP